ncbi:MAG: hypothetical protein SGJ09_17475 [Phycisphaerae bacterium]|nr:hypothetical protein [Phycisphaerae bacterium]MDZ4831970.1 hypothetical protein [Phycisphaerae bacterium]
MPRPFPLFTFLAGLTLITIGTGCSGGTPPAPPSGESSAARGSGEQTSRIVSLSPAITRTLVDLGAANAVVGRTPFCASIPASTPIVGSLLDLDLERLLSVRPTHVLIQPAATGTDPELVRLAASRGWRLGQWRLDRLDDVAHMLDELPATLGSEGSPLARSAAERRESIVRLREVVPAADSPRVLLLVSIEPMVAAGTETFLSDVLAGIGCRNAIDRRAYPEVSHEDLIRLVADSIVVLREREPSLAERERIVSIVLADDALRSRFAGRIVVFGDDDAMLPSSAVLAMSQRLRRAISTEAPRESAAGAAR